MTPTAAALTKHFERSRSREHTVRAGLMAKRQAFRGECVHACFKNASKSAFSLSLFIKGMACEPPL